MCHNCRSPAQAALSEANGLEMTTHDVAVIGSGFAGSLLARILARLGYAVVLLERGTHPRFAIGESTTPLANLSLERISRRYGLDDCYDLAAHGRWLRAHPELRRGLKRGFTFYRHHPGQHLDAAERLLVAASPTAEVSDSHWMRSDVDEHFVRAAVAAGVDYRDRVELVRATIDDRGARLSGVRDDAAFTLDVEYVVDASGPGGFLARQLGIPSGLDRARTHSAILFSHFEGTRPMADIMPQLPPGPYPDDWAAMHHVIDEGWMYVLRFDDGVVSAGFALSPRGLASLPSSIVGDPDAMWQCLMGRYPTIAATFAGARPLMPLVYRPRVQHRLTQAAGERWAMLPHAYAFTDALFSTGIAWGLRGIERLALAFEDTTLRRPSASTRRRYDQLLSAEADQIDTLVAGAYEAMAHFDLFAAHALIYFSTVSYAEAYQRLVARDSDVAAWSGFLGVGDPHLESLPGESYRRLQQKVRIPRSARDDYVTWVQSAIGPRNICGFGDPARRHLYPVDLDLLVERHDLLSLTREDLVAALPALRGFQVMPS